jgi:hypothetical protein
MLGAEQFFRPLTRQTRRYRQPAAAVIAFRGSLGVFVGHDAAGSFHYRLGNKVFGSDEFEFLVLTIGFTLKCVVYFRIKLLQV